MVRCPRSFKCLSWALADKAGGGAVRVEGRAQEVASEPDVVRALVKIAVEQRRKRACHGGAAGRV